MAQNKMRQEVFALKKRVIEMANLASSMLADAMQALQEHDVDLANKTEQKKHKLRALDYEIEKEALHLIALYQPLAIDLRRSAAILKIITYLTRIGRYGKDIAQIVAYLNDNEAPNRFINLKHIWEHVQSMIDDAIQAFDESDIKYIQNFEKRDDEVDSLRWSIFRESVSYMMEDPHCITPCAHILMIARYLERCGDHACKIAEKVHYMVTGEHKEIS
ncbi:MAG: phosphate signaling complex protein PhoU [Promethearchaeia archaeon]